MPVKIMSQEDLHDLDLEVPVRSGFWLESYGDVEDLYKANYISLSVLDRIDNSIADIRYNYPKGTRFSLGLLESLDGRFIIFKRILEE